MNVLSLFDGISCGRVALERTGIKVDNYYASEVDKYAQQVSAKNYPDIVRLGDVTKWKEWSVDWSSIDLVIGGSPCQGFSAAGKQGGTKAELDGETHVVTSREMYNDFKNKGAKFLSQSYLFWEFVLLLDHVKSENPNVKFMLENVRMTKNNMDMITEALGVEPVCINSSLVSAQNRVRYYWANWSFGQPEDRGVMLKGVLEDGSEKVGRMVGRKINPETGKRDDYNPDLVAEQRIEPRSNSKSGTLTTVQKDNLVIRPATPRASHGGGVCKHVADATDIKGNESIKRVYSPEGKAPCLTTMGGGHREPKVLVREKSKCVRASGRGSYDRHEWDSISDCHYRKLTPTECERLQTLPDGYTDCVSNTQRYKGLGNGWTVDVIAHIFEGLKK